MGLGCARSTSEGEGVVLCDLREKEGVASVRERRGGVGLCREQREQRRRAEASRVLENGLRKNFP